MSNYTEFSVNFWDSVLIQILGTTVVPILDSVSNLFV
jgi:hypothetical protein